MQVTEQNKCVCKCCNSISVYSSRLVSHFAAEHAQLYNFLTAKYLEFSSEGSGENSVAGDGSSTTQERSESLPQEYQHQTENGRSDKTMHVIQEPNYQQSHPNIQQNVVSSTIQSDGVTTQLVSQAQEVSAAPSQNSLKKPAGGFESAFLSFMNNAQPTAAPTEVLHVDSTPNLPLPQSPSSSQNASSSSPRKLVRNYRARADNSQLDDSCNICHKSFERTNSKGETKSNGRLKAEINNHYLSHFRDKLVAKYPSSFSGSPPFSCEKCGFVSKSQLNQISAVKQIMLTHVASCGGELESLIANCGPKQSNGISANQSSVLSRVETNQKPDTNVQEPVSWKSSPQCLVCNANIPDTIKNYHYVNHFKDTMKEMFSTEIKDSSSYKCPFCSVVISADSDSRIAQLNFLIHVGDSHDIFSELIGKKKDTSPVKQVTAPLNGVDNKENNKFHPQQIFQPSPSPQKHAVRKPSAPTDSFQSFLRYQELNPTCLRCNQQAPNMTVLMRHLLRKHYAENINNEILQYFPTFYQQEVVQGDVVCKVCGTHLPAVRSHVTEHCGVGHREVLKHYFVDVKNDLKNGEVKQVETDAEELDTETVLMALMEDLDEDNEDTAERREVEAVNKIQDYLAKAKASHKTFVQVGPCHLIDPQLSPCHECHKIISQNRKVSTGICCCFEGFRKLKYINDDRLVVAGYLNPTKDPRQADIDTWSLDAVSTEGGDLTQERALFILAKVGGLLCDLVTEERRLLASAGHVSWRRQHAGVREMCDVCSTSIFNVHLTCATCGLMVCGDCYTARRAGTRYRPHQASAVKRSIGSTTGFHNHVEVPY